MSSMALYVNYLASQPNEERTSQTNDLTGIDTKRRSDRHADDTKETAGAEENRPRHRRTTHLDFLDYESERESVGIVDRHCFGHLATDLRAMAFLFPLIDILFSFKRRFLSNWTLKLSFQIFAESLITD